MDSIESTGNLISIVVPVHNENESLPQLAEELTATGKSHSLKLEIIFIDDGSTDGSWKTIRGLAEADSRIRGIRFRRNFGKAAALAAGFEDARGSIVFQMDADLQDDPAELPRFLSRLQTGVDIVNGWKRTRHDPWHKVWPSRVFNWMVSRLTGLKLHDHNCGFKCFRAETVKELQLYGELHRFIPVIAFARGYRVEEMEIGHRPRRYSHSKYGFRRIPNGFLDLMTVTFLTVFGQCPLHLLGGIGLVPFSLGGLGLVYLAVYWLLARLGLEGYGPIGQRPLLMYSVASVLLGLHLLSIGFLAELLLSLNIRHVNSFSVLERTQAGFTNSGTAL